MYEGIRDRIHITNATDKNHTEAVESTDQEERGMFVEHNGTEFEIDSSISQSRKCEADEVLDDAFRIIKGKLHTDPNLISGAIKFAERVRGMSNSRLASALHCFGSDKTSHSLKTSKAAPRNAKRNKIKVQPEAVKRRKTANGPGKSKVKVITKKSGAQFQITHRLRAKVCTSSLRMCSTMSLLQRRQDVQCLLSPKLVEESYWQKRNTKKLMCICICKQGICWTASYKRLNFLWSILQRRYSVNLISHEFFPVCGRFVAFLFNLKNVIINTKQLVTVGTLFYL